MFRAGHRLARRRSYGGYESERLGSYDPVVSAVALDFDRHVACIGCFNFRDLGGYRTADGRWTRPHRLYRADGPHALTDADIAKLAALGLVTVIDLRTPSEV